MLIIICLGLFGSIKKKIDVVEILLILTFLVINNKISYLNINHKKVNNSCCSWDIKGYEKSTDYK